jgi:immune inhibitor A
MACACVALAVGVGVLWVRRVPLSPAPIGSASLHLEELVSQEQMPPYDPVVEVSGLQGGREIPRIVHESPVAYEVGDRQPFWVSGLDNSAAYQITATLYVQLDSVQMWVDEQAQVDLSALYASATTFQDRVQPTTRRYFGTEWSPGIDGDPRLVVLSANIEGAAGYFASANEYARQVHANSNEREMFVMNLNALTPGSVGFDAVLAHEYQHMIHWHQDRNEDTWVNEGASDLSEELNGFDSSQVTLRAFGQNPDLQLTSWPDGDDSVVAHYGASYLMMHYFLRRYGPDMLRELILEPANGAVGFDAVLARHEAGTDFDGLFADWVVANGVDDPDWDDGRFGYALLDVNAASAESSMQRIGRYPAAVQGDVSQYGADYFELAPAGPGGQPLRLTFSGQPSVRLVPNDPTSGEYQWWSNRGDGGHSYLERVFDLREVQAATLAFDLWYDIEEGWDYAHVRASTDGGRTWQLLRGSHMTDYNPEGNAWGPGYTGQSGDTVSFAMRQGEGSDAQWVREEIDLGAYVGSEVLVRFDYITDDGVNRPGLCLDSLALRAIGWRDDVEEGEAGWHTEGFIRHNNHVPQRFVVQLVEFTPQPQLRRLTAEPGQELQWTIEGLGGRVERALLIVSAIAPVTTERASYRLRMQ